MTHEGAIWLEKEEKSELLNLDHMTHIHRLIKPLIRHMNFSNFEPVKWKVKNRVLY